MIELKPTCDPTFLSGFLTEEVFLLAADRGTVQESSPEIAAGTENPLVSSEEPVAITQEARMKDRGDYKKRILFLSRVAIFQGSREEDLLEKIMAAVNLTWNDVKLVHQYPGLEELEKSLAPRLLIAFGASSLPDGWPAGHALGEIFHVEKTYFLATLNLEALLVSRDDKVILWNNLKTLFKIKS